jgi:predicted dienelactone hydrolase
MFRRRRPLNSGRWRFFMLLTKRGRAVKSSWLPVIVAVLGLACGSNGGESGAQDTSQPSPADTVSDAADTGAVDTGPGVEDTGPVLPLPPDPTAWPATAPGPYNVGYHTMEVTYQPKGVDGPRTLRLAVWYPTEDKTGTAANYRDLFVQETVFQDAEPAPHGPWPVHIYSHGNLAFAEVSFFLTEYLASHGWLVAAPDHTGNTIETLGDDLTTEVYMLRPQDISAVLDKLYNLDPEHKLSDRVGDTVVVSGHSFGGYTAFSSAGATYPMDEHVPACEAGTGPGAFCSTLDAGKIDVFKAGFLDPRVGLIVPLAPGGENVLGPAGVADVDVPILMITGAKDKSTTNAGSGDPYWNAVDGPSDMRVDIATAAHQTFTIICDFVPLLGKDDGCGDEFIEPAVAHQIINSYTLAFSRYHLMDDTSVGAILDGTQTLSDEVTLSFK